MSWTILLGTARLLCWGALAWMGLARADVRRAAQVHSDGRVEFGRNGFAYLAWILFTIDFAWSAIKDLASSKPSPHLLVNGACLGLLALLLLFSFPGTVALTSDGLEEVYWLRRNKRIQWRDIVEINTGEKSRTVTITGADGTRIVHSAQLADRARLLLELKQHCGDSLPPDFPREPIATVSTVNQN
jgi:Bacterial PH domain